MRNTSMANDFEQSIANESSKNSPPSKLPMLQDEADKKIAELREKSTTTTSLIFLNEHLNADV